MISTKFKSPKLIKPTIGGQANCQYLYYSPNKKTTSVQRIIADIFCPDFWTNARKLHAGERLEAHHCDGQNMHNVWWNIVLLPSSLHTAIHRIKSIKLSKDGEMIKYLNPLDILLKTGLSLEEIITPEQCSDCKCISDQNNYKIYNNKGYIMEYRYFSKK